MPGPETQPMRVVLRSVACLLAVWTAFPADPIGRTVANEGELLHAIGRAEVVSQVDVQFPARIVRIQNTVPGPATAGMFGAAPTSGPSGLRRVVVEHTGGTGVVLLRAPGRH